MHSSSYYTPRRRWRERFMVAIDFGGSFLAFFAMADFSKMIIALIQSRDTDMRLIFLLAGAISFTLLLIGLGLLFHGFRRLFYLSKL